MGNRKLTSAAIYTSAFTGLGPWRVEHLGTEGGVYMPLWMLISGILVIFLIQFYVTNRLNRNH